MPKEPRCENGTYTLRAPLLRPFTHMETLVVEGPELNPEVLLFMRGTANPGKPGHPWIKRRFIDKCGKHGETVYLLRPPFQ